jgi:flavin reductase (DIM6/NTAB) family NADH-FMN oxidoreductase RutF
MSGMDSVHRYFATTVGLITTDGKHGPNVMAAEWTMQVSYDPMLVAIFIHDSPTLWNIRDSGAFGVNIASEGQSEQVNVAGGYSGTEIDKLAIPGIFHTYREKSVPMLRGCALNAECRVESIADVGDHVMVLGRVVDAAYDEKKNPLIYTRGNYRRLGAKIPSGRAVVRVSPAAFSEFKRMSAGQFVLKAAAARVERGKAVLLTEFAGSWALPVVAVRRGVSYKEELRQHLALLGVDAKVNEMAAIHRLVLRSEGQDLRANFIVFRCARSAGRGRWFARPPKNVVLRRLLEKP